MRKAKNAFLGKDRKWPYIIIEFEDGKRKSFAKHVAVEEAEKLLSKIRNRIELGTFELEDFTRLKANYITLVKASLEFINEREKQHELENLSKATIEKDYYSMKLFVGYIGKDFIVAKITKQEIEQFALDLKNKIKNQYGRNYRIDSIRSYLKHLSSFFTWAREKKYITNNPVSEMGGMREKRKGKDRILFCRDDEIEVMRQYLNERPAWQLDAFNFALWTSARVSELMSVRVSDYFVIPADDGVRRVIRLFGKGNKARYIPLFSECVQLVEKRMNWLKDEQSVAKLTVHVRDSRQISLYKKRWKKGFLFFEVNNTKSISHAITKAKRACGLREDVKFHSTRHTFATDLLMQGVDIKVVSELMGHSDLRTTEIYAKVLNETMVKSMEKVKAK